MFKRGQAAMEFLMTYGWAMLAAIIAIGVLANFGVFSPGRLVGGVAAVSPPFFINTHNVLNTHATLDGTVNLDMIQNSGSTLNTVTVTITGTGSMFGTTCTRAGGAIATWNSGTSQTMAMDCTNGAASDSMTAGGQFTGDITASYLKQGSTLTLQSTGNIKNTIQ